ncbi:MAG: hypothetical protein K9J17_14310 [Flavobacteriales bacterium]|nr:hypothetical protein [Flavobacteriales bacterium]
MLQNFPRFYTGVEDREAHLLKLLYSATYFAFTFILVSYVSHAFSTANAWDVGYRPNFSYDGMDDLRGTTGWTPFRIGWVYLAPPIWGLAISIFALICFRFIDGRQAHLRTILFWLAVNGYLLYFSYIISGLLSGMDYGSPLFSGFVGFYSWLDWEKPKVIGVVIIQLIISIPFALLFSKGVLQLNYSRLLAAKNNGKPVIFLHVFIIPIAIGAVLIALSTFPMDLGLQVIRLLSFLPVVIVVFLGLGLHKAKHISIVKGGLRNVSIAGAIVLVSLLLLSRFGLQVSVQPFW